MNIEIRLKIRGNGDKFHDLQENKKASFPGHPCEKTINSTFEKEDWLEEFAFETTKKNKNLPLVV